MSQRPARAPVPRHVVSRDGASFEGASSQSAQWVDHWTRALAGRQEHPAPEAPRVPPIPSAALNAEIMAQVKEQARQDVEVVEDWLARGVEDAVDVTTEGTTADPVTVIYEIVSALEADARAAVALTEMMLEKGGDPSVGDR